MSEVLYRNGGHRWVGSPPGYACLDCHKRKPVVIFMDERPVEEMFAYMARLDAEIGPCAAAKCEESK